MNNIRDPPISSYDRRDQSVRCMEEESNIEQQVLRSTLEEARSRKCNRSAHRDPCVICLEPITERAVAAPCNHTSFDFLCLVSWLQERSNCPLCNAEVLSVEYDWRSPQDFQTYTVPPSKTPQSQAPSAIFDDLRTRRRRLPSRPWRTSRPSGTHQPMRADTALLRRKEIYRRQLYALHVGSNRLSRFQDLTPQLFNQDQELVSRARKWIRRELQVFDFLNMKSEEDKAKPRKANNAEFLLEYIIAILKTVDTQGSRGQAEDMLQEFLGRDNTRHFLHELRAWLRSPYSSLEDWDRHVQYPKATATSVPGEKAEATAMK